MKVSDKKVHNIQVERLRKVAAELEGSKVTEKFAEPFVLPLLSQEVLDRYYKGELDLFSAIWEETNPE